MDNETKVTKSTMFNQQIVSVKGVHLEKVIQKAKDFSKLNKAAKFKKYGPTQENDVWCIEFYFQETNKEITK